MLSVSCLVNLGSFCFSLGIQHITTTPYYPSPSHAERFNRNLRAALTAHHADSQTKWDEDLPWLQVAFNIATHEATSMTPFEVIPFRGKAPLANRWKNQDLPNTCSPLGVRRSWDNVRKHTIAEDALRGNITAAVNCVRWRLMILCGSRLIP
jgi:hypothetical protein